MVSILSSLIQVNETKEGIETQIIVISDGHFENSNQILQMVSSLPNNMRLFAFGVGILRGSSSIQMLGKDPADGHCLRQMARIGKGISELTQNEKMLSSEKITQVMEKIRQHSFTNIRYDFFFILTDFESVTWNTSKEADSIQQSPKPITSLFRGDSLVVYGFAG